MKGMPYFNSLIRSYALFYTPHLSDGRLARSGEQLTARLLWVIAVSVSSSAGRSPSVTQSSCHIVILSCSYLVTHSFSHTIILHHQSLSHSHFHTKLVCHTILLLCSNLVTQSSCNKLIFTWIYHNILHHVTHCSCHPVILCHSQDILSRVT